MSLTSKAFAPDSIQDAPGPRAVEPLPRAIARLRRRGAWCRFFRSGDYTTDTSDAPLSRSSPVRAHLLSLTKLLLIQNAILSRHELPALSMHSSTERGGRCQS